MKCQHQHAEHVFPIEGRSKEITPEDDLFPDAAGDHDGVEGQRLHHDRPCRYRQTLACGEVAQNKEQAGKKHQELHRRQDALDQRPDRGVATNTLLGGVKRRPRFRW